MKIIVHGTVAYDRIMDFPGYFKDNILPDKIHHINVSFYIENVTEMRGGTGGNIAYNLALLDEEATIVTAAGKDARPYIDHLESLGLTTDGIEMHDDILTPAASIITDKGNNQITAFSVGAAKRTTSFKLKDEDPENTIMVLSPANNKPDVLKYMKQCKSLGIPYIFDPGQTIPDFRGADLRECIDGALMFTVNDYEMELVKKKSKLTEKQIVDKVGMLIVTLGAKGSVITRKKEKVKITAFSQHKVLDPTGAGDAYRAGLVKGISRDLPLKEIGQLGACAASYAIEHVGTQEHTYTLAHFRKRYKTHLGEKCPI